MMRALAVWLALTSSAAALEPVRDFDVARYLGLWHEIASIPAWFQEDCAYATTATYNRDPDPARLRVLNACRRDDGTAERALGRARFTQAPDIGALEVTFLRLFGAWRWFAAGDYVVIALGPDEAWSVVGHPTRDYGWVLARQPQLATEALVDIAATLVDAGYDSCRFLTSPARPGEARRPLCDVVEGP